MIARLPPGEQDGRFSFPAPGGKPRDVGGEPFTTPGVCSCGRTDNAEELSYERYHLYHRVDRRDCCGALVLRPALIGNWARGGRAASLADTSPRSHPDHYRQTTPPIVPGVITLDTGLTAFDPLPGFHREAGQVDAKRSVSSKRDQSAVSQSLLCPSPVAPPSAMRYRSRAHDV